MCVRTWLCFLQFPARAPPLLHDCPSLPVTLESGHQHCRSRPPTSQPDRNCPPHSENLLPIPARTPQPQPLGCSVCSVPFFFFFNILILWSNVHRGFPGGSVVKNLPANAGEEQPNPRVGKIPWRRRWQPTPVFLPGKVHGQRNLAGYSPRGHKGSNTT